MIEVIAEITESHLMRVSALGALGRRFESCRPDHLNPSYTSDFPRLAFFMFMSQN